MLPIYLPLVLGASVLLLYLYFTRTFDYWKKRNVCGPKPVVFFGNLKESTLRKKNMGIILQDIYKDFPNEKVVGIYRMTTPCLIIRDLDLIKHIMIKDFDMFVDRGIEFSDEGLGLNLFHANAKTWRILRNRFTPIFTSGKLKNMLYLMIEQGDIFLKYLNNACAKNMEQEVHHLVQNFTMTTISACGFGLNLDMHTDELETLRKIDKLVMKINFATELDMMYPGILKILNSSLFPAFVGHFFNDLVKKIIKQRNGTPTNRKDFMDLILELRQQKEVVGSKRDENDEQRTLQLNDDIIAAQAFVFFVAGYETSATTMTFLLYELARNPDVQEKLIAEIDEVLERYDGKITYEALNDMTYLDYTFTETLRMYSLVEPLQRNAQVDYTLPGTDIVVKKGQTVLISSRGIHKDEKYYPNPDHFDPERWTVENSRDRHPCAYLPFGLGPRNCIGMRFAKIQSRVCIVKMLSNYRVGCSKNTIGQMEYDPARVLISPKERIYLNIIPRKHI